MRQVTEEHSIPDGAAVFVAMELSKSAWLLAVQGSPSGKISSHRLEGGDVAGLLALLRRLQVREQQACRGSEVQIVLGYGKIPSFPWAAFVNNPDDRVAAVEERPS